MTIVQLEYLLAVVNFGSFSLAAERSFVTQPSLSMQIKNLEEELGVVLLDRSKKPVILTQAGEVVAERARDVVKMFNSVYEDVAVLKGTVSGVLRLGVIPTVAPYLLPRMVQDFAGRCPDVHLEIKEMITPQIVRAMEHDEIDAAILAGGTCPEGITEDCIFDDRFYAYLSPGHRLFERSNIRLEDLDLKEMLLLSEGHCFRDQILDLCPSKGGACLVLLRERFARNADADSGQYGVHDHHSGDGGAVRAAGACRAGEAACQRGRVAQDSGGRPPYLCEGLHRQGA